MKNRKRSLFIGILIMFSVLVSGLTFAYWASNVIGTTESAVGTVTIGSGDEETISITVDNTTTGTDVLIPSTLTADTGETTTKTVTITVNWNANSNLTGIVDANISAVVSNIEVNGIANPYSLITVTPVLAPTTIGHTETVTFTFNITLGEPSNSIEYIAVAGLDITFDITFTVSPN